MDPRPERKTLPHDTPHWIDPSSEIYFITINCQERGSNLLCIEPIAEILFESVIFRHQAHEWYVRLFLLMPDHLHALLSFSPDVQIQKSLSNWKSWTAKRSGIRWQRDFFEHRLRGDEGFAQKADYIRHNPMRANLASHPDEWPWVLWSDPNDGSLLRSEIR